MNLWPLEIADETIRDQRSDPERDALAPINRGYWFNEEVMKLARIGSDAVLQKVLASKAAHASYVGTRPKGRRRAWSARNVIRTMLVSAVAAENRMPFIAASALIGACGARQIDTLLGVTGLLKALSAMRVTGLERVLIDGNFPLEEAEALIEPASIITINWRYVFWSDKSCEFTPLARIHSLDGKTPRVVPSSSASKIQDVRSRHYLSVDAVLRDFVHGVRTV